MDDRIFTCRTPGCQGPTTGVCINGLTLDECPDIVPMFASDASTVAASGSSVTGVERMADTGNAATLDAISCDALLRQRGGAVVGIAAGPEVGKTTMIATLYELVHRGRMNAFRFAGSETLRGYEERSYLARISSNLGKPDTPRTRTSSKLSFTHLRLATELGFRDVFFSDRSGESFDGAVNRPGAISQFSELARADVTLLLIDLNELIKRPHLPTSYARRLFMSLEQSGLLAGKRVRIVGTKADLLNEGGETESAQNAISNLAEEFIRRSAGKVQIRSTMVACRARSGTAKFGLGIEGLLTDILEEDSSKPIQADNYWPEAPSELDSLMLPHRSRLV